MQKRSLSFVKSVMKIALGLSILCPASALAQAPLVPLKVAYIATVNLLTAFVAKDVGLFERNGLAVTLIPTQNSSLLPGTVGKQVNIAIVTAPDLIKSAASGLDVVGICGGTIETAARNSVALIVRKDSGITSIKDLKGKVIATPTIGAGIHTATLYWLRKSGVDVNSIRAVEVPFPNMGDQLAAKRVDAIEAIQPFIGRLLATGNISLGNPNLHVSDPSLQTLWLANGQWARANKKIVKAWTTSIKEAIAYIEKNPAASREILGKYTHLPKPVIQHVPMPYFETSIRQEWLDVWIKLLHDMGQISQPVNAEKLLVTGD